MASSRFFRTVTRNTRKAIPENAGTIKCFGTDQEISDAIASARSNSAMETALFGVPFPVEYKTLRTGPLIAWIDLSRELNWYALTCKFYAPKLNSLLVEVQQYEKLLFAERYSDALVLLGTIEHRYGVSLWLLKQQLLLNELVHGMERQKILAHSLQKEEIEVVVRCFAHYYSVRVEQSISFSRFDILVNRAVSGWLKQVPGTSLAAYFDYHMAYFSDRRPPQHVHVLVREGRSALLDRFLAFRRTAQMITAGSRNVTVQRALRSALFVLGDKLNDPFVATLQHLHGFHSAAVPNLQPALLQVINLYTQGDETNALESALAEICANPHQFPSYEIAAKSALLLGRDPNSLSLPADARRTIGAMISIMTADDRARESAEYLYKRILVHETSPWAAQLLGFVQNEYHYFGRPAPHSIPLFAELNSHQQPNPRLVTALARYRRVLPSSLNVPPFDRDPVFQLARLTSGARDASELESGLDALHVPAERRMRLLADFLLTHKEESRALAVYREIQSLGAGREHHSGLVGIVSALIHIGAVVEATELIADELLARPNLWAKLPLHQLITGVMTRPTTEFSDSLALAIVFEHYCRFIGGDYELQRADACEDYLGRHNCQAPASLPLPVSPQGKKRLIFFLRHVCVPQVLDSLPWVDGSLAVQQQRLAICQRLLDIDPEPAVLEDYTREIKEITKAISISRGLRAVEQSRIYVDVDGIRQNLSLQLLDSYHRYLGMGGSSVTKMNKIARWALEIKDLTALADRSIQVLIPQDETLDLMRTMITEIRDQFTGNNECGLNSSLSMGIRHGTLSGHIRPVLERAHLVTRKRSRTEYANNEYWTVNYPVPPAKFRELQDRLAQFSKEIDEYIDSINDQHIQIRTEDSTKPGFFNFRIEDELVLDIVTRVQPDTPFEKFIDMVLDQMWAMTDASLTKVREFLESNAQNEMIRGLERLRSDVTSQIGGEVARALDTNATHAITEMPYCFNRVSSWFTRAGAEEVGDCDLALAVRIAGEMLVNLYRENPIQLDIKVPAGMGIKSRALTPLCNVFFNLLDNCRKYMATGIDQGQVRVIATLDEKWLKITITNPIDAVLSIDAANAGLEDLRLLVGRSDFIGHGSLNKVGKEGRSGFHKIAKLLYFDLSSQYLMDMQHREGEFEVTIQLEARKVAP